MNLSSKQARPGTVHHCSQVLVLSKNEGLVDGAASVSSCPSSSSDSSDSDDDTPKPKLYRLKYTIPNPITPFALPPLRIIRHKSEPEKYVVVVEGFLSESRIRKLRDHFRVAETVYQIKDRKDDLYHAHKAYRVEVALRLRYPKIYRKIMGISMAVCTSVWGEFKEKRIRRNRVIPELEYIVYDMPDGNGRGTFIEPHVDNHSIVTGVVMLSKPGEDFEGGANRFKGAESESSEVNYREYQLQQGDLVLFRGELVTHWITPVTRGVREILQWELSRV